MKDIMDRLIRTTTEHFLAMLDDQREFYSPDELVEAGLPDFLVKRMQLELMRNLQDSVTPPQSDWADMSTAAVREAWGHFLEAIHEEIRLPASFSASVIESSLADILDLMVTPRAFLPEYIFGSASKLDLKSIRERCEWVVVYNYFATTLPRFMEKKGRATLTKEQADRIIERLDNRVTSHYTSLNWAQLFEPWFQLLGEKVEPGLFASFFRDKGKPGVARLFDAESEPLHRSRLIEILSKPQLDEIDDEFDEVGGDLLEASVGVIDLADIGAPDAEKDAEAMAVPEKTTEAKPEPESRKEPEQAKDTEPEPAKGKEPETAKDAEPEQAKDKEPEPPAATEKPPSPDKQKEAKSEPKAEVKTPVKSETESEEREKKKVEATSEQKKSETAQKEIAEKQDEAGDEEGNLIARYQKTNGNDKHDPSLISMLKGEPGEEENEEDTIPLYSRIKQDPEDENSDDVPIWKKFTHENEEDSGEPEVEGIVEDDIVPDEAEEPEEDDTGPDTAEEIEKVRSYMKDMEEEFVTELFGGDDGAFLDAIGHITRLSSWKEAGSYISKEVFDRNLIDIYSDTAIYFTDRMQTYFLERE